MYDKFHLVLRIETTANDVSFFKHHRRVEHRQGPSNREHPRTVLAWETVRQSGQRVIGVSSAESPFGLKTISFSDLSLMYAVRDV
jgi:hypothetical protein